MSALPPHTTLPESEHELLRRAHAIAGRTLEDIATRLGQSVPATLTRAKGFVGRLIEDALGAGVSSRPEPDFLALGIELKTLPIDKLGVPRESTYVARVELAPSARRSWATSSLKKKLARVLWIPVEAEATIPIAHRRIGTPVLWSPNEGEEATIRADWEGFADLVAHGFIETITARRGLVLQIRPKAQRASDRTISIDDDGGAIETLPRGFYLRRTFTSAILRRHFGP